VSAVPRTLFVGRGKGAVCWYRCALPALYLDLDWIGVSGDPGSLRTVTGKPGVAAAEADWRDYEVVVVQQPRGRVWVDRIRALQDVGVRVLFEIDDYIHAVRKSRDHDFRAAFGEEVVRDVELAMRVCDGVICSTPWLARRYRAFNATTYVCRNGLDLGRYALTLPARDAVHIGWAGGTGHRRSVRPWLDAVADVMRSRPATRFVSIGQPFAKALQAEFGEERCIAVPFTTLDCYPAAMASFDVAIAPAGRTNFFRGKSDLRFLEAGALGQAIVADPTLYDQVEHGVTGFLAETAAEAHPHLLALVDDADLRARVGAAAREYVHRERDMRVMSRQWAAALWAAVGREPDLGEANDPAQPSRT
jgi:glycosyltransferase involved in cell wall biosynthesis